MPVDQLIEVCRVISGMQNLKTLTLQQRSEEQVPEDWHLDTLPNIFQNMYQQEGNSEIRIAPGIWDPE